MQNLVELDERLDELCYHKACDPASWRDYQSKYDLCWIYHENALDGIAITPDEITEALACEITTNISQVSAYRRVRNYRAAMEYITEKSQKADLVCTIDMLRDLHCILANGLDTGLGRFRRNSPVHRAYFQDICQPSKIEKILNEMLAMVNAEIKRPTMHPLELAGKVQFMFMEAYPFSSWSGIVGRFFTNMLLMQADYLPLVIHGHDRQRYYQAVASSSAAVTRVLADAYENTLDNAFHYFVEPRQMLAGA